jgi:NHS family xanthosine MFS transporter
MSIKLRLIIMNFLQFFIWGSWLISLGGYLIVTLGFSGIKTGSIFATMGIASLLCRQLWVLLPIAFLMRNGY